MRNARAVTVADVARRAGVSPSTVSRALNGVRDVDPALQERVLAAAADLGYRVNLVGRALRQQRTATVGLVVPDLENPFFSSLAHHLSRAFLESGIDLLIFNADGALETERRGVQSFLGRQVDALVLIPCHETESGASVQLAASAVRTIQLDRVVTGTGAHFVGVDNLAGMALAHQHVVASVDTDEQPVVFVGGETSSSSGHERLDGFRRHFGADAPVLVGRFDAAWGQEAADRLLADGWLRGTVVAGADVIAVGLLGRLQAAGFRVPDDFRIVGFDGIGVARLAHPTLTTVRQPVEEMSRSIRELVEHPGTIPGPTTLRHSPQLVVGESSPARGTA
jgi:LacI family transcriptional regulator